MNFHIEASDTTPTTAGQPIYTETSFLVAEGQPTQEQMDLGKIKLIV